MPYTHKICRDGKIAIFRSRVHTAKGRGLCSLYIAVNGALSSAFPTALTTASGSTYSRSKFEPRLILGTFRDVPGRILNLRLRLQSVGEVLLGSNWRCRKAVCAPPMGVKRIIREPNYSRLSEWESG